MFKNVEFIVKNFTKKFFMPLMCNQKPVFRSKKGKYKLHRGSYCVIPKGTKINIYENSDCKDADSDTSIVSVYLDHDVDAIVTRHAMSTEERN